MGKQLSLFPNLGLSAVAKRGPKETNVVLVIHYSCGHSVRLNYTLTRTNVANKVKSCRWIKTEKGHFWLKSEAPCLKCASESVEEI